MNKIYTLLILALFLGMSSSYAQSTSLRSIEKSAKKAMNSKDYYSAWKFYEVAFREKSGIERDSSIFKEEEIKNDDALEYLYNLGQAAREFKAYGVAELAYKKVMLSPKSATNHPLVEFWLARVYHRQGKYDKAIDYYSNFTKEAGQTPKGGTVNEKQEYIAVAESAIKNCTWAKDQREFTGFKMDSLKSVNTYQTEFAPLEHKSSMYYSALEFDEEDACPDPNSEVTRLYTSDYTGTGGTTSPINWAKEEKGKFVAHTTFNGDGDKMYFTICNRINAVEFQCEIYYRDKSTGMWGDAIKLPEAVNLTGTTSTQPNIGYDENLGKELLFFVSNRADSLGGANSDMNIYCSIIDTDGQVSAPTKIDVNTPEDDVTPFFNKANKTLYFSSKGYQGFGGYDIYQAEQMGSTFAEPIPLEKPINSSYDDYYFSADENLETLYFSTNRLGVTYKGEGLETCCDDIYKLEIIKVKLEVTTFNTLTGAEGLDSCEVALYDVTNPNNEVLVEKKLDPNGNFYQFELELEKDYKLKSTRGEQWEYNGDENRIIPVEFTTKDLTASQTIKKQLYHTPEIIWNVYTFVKTDECNYGSMVSLPNCIFDFSNELSTESLSKVEDDNHFFKKLQSGDVYTIEANDTTFFFPDPNSSNIVSQSTKGITTPKTFNDTIYFTLVDIGDLTLYFHNDYPKRVKGKNGRWIKDHTITEDKYKVLYEEYLQRRGEYKAENQKVELGTRGDSEKAINIFFDDYVIEQYTNIGRYIASFQRLEKVFKDSDCQIQIDMLGITSPKASKSYNNNLAMRRIHCFNEYLKTTATDLQDVLPKDLDDKTNLFIYSYCPIGKGGGENCSGSGLSNEDYAKIIASEKTQIEGAIEEILKDVDPNIPNYNKLSHAIYGIGPSARRKVVLSEIKLLPNASNQPIR